MIYFQFLPSYIHMYYLNIHLKQQHLTGIGSVSAHFFLRTGNRNAPACVNKEVIIKGGSGQVTVIQFHPTASRKTSYTDLQHYTCIKSRSILFKNEISIHRSVH